MRTQTINKIIADNGYQSYLEIGLGDGSNFRNIKIPYRVGVDPDSAEILTEAVVVLNETSDGFFNTNHDQKFDIIFIDGDHTAQQVERDIINAYKALNKGGMILLHDCNPPSEKAQMVPREQVQWTGDVWRSAVGFESEYGEKINTGYIDDPYGIYVIWKTGRFAVKEGFTNYDMTYKEFNENRKKLLGV